jgi:YVTN family beta-propeller protein
VLTLLKEIQLVAGGDSVGFSAAHSLDVLAQGAGEAKYIVVSNKADNSVSVINAADNLIKQTVTNVGSLPFSVIVYAQEQPQPAIKRRHPSREDHKPRHLRCLISSMITAC